jgi:DNA-binding response OmpR family regulator
MIVDDEGDIIYVLEYALAKAGYGVDSFTDPVAALKHFRENRDRYSLVVSDVRMPQMSGFDLARQIKQAKPGMKILFMTAYEIAQSESDRMLSLGEIDGIIKKPFSSGQLVEAVKSQLAKP